MNDPDAVAPAGRPNGLLDCSATTTIEYGLVAAVVALAISTGFSVVAEETLGMWSNIANEISGALEREAL